MTDEGAGHHQEPAEPVPTPPPAAAPGAPGVGEAADVGTRFLARLIDHILLGIVLTVIFVPLVLGAIWADVSGFSGMFGGLGIGSLVSSIVVAVLTIGYFALMESNQGQTVGKMLLGLKTVGPDGNKPSLERAVKRNAWIALSIVPWIGGLAQLAVAIYIAVTISQSAANVGWHDEFAGGTRVIKTR